MYGKYGRFKRMTKEEWLKKNGFSEDGVTYVITGGNTYEVKDILKQNNCVFNKLLGWLYKDLTDECIEKITRCYDCQYYKKYKKKGAVKGAAFYACSINKVKRRPDFYCKDGEPKR